MKPPEQVKRELVRKWIKKAEQDYNLASHLVAEKLSFYEAAGFHSQQAAEKFLKAYLTWAQVEFPKTHDLDKLLELICAVDANLAEALSEIASLTVYGVELRYPGHLPELTFEEAEKAVELAARTRQVIIDALKKKAEDQSVFDITDEFNNRDAR